MSLNAIWYQLVPFPGRKRAEEGRGWCTFGWNCLKMAFVTVLRSPTSKLRESAVKWTNEQKRKQWSKFVAQCSISDTSIFQCNSKTYYHDFTFDLLLGMTENWCMLMWLIIIVSVSGTRSCYCTVTWIKKSKNCRFEKNSRGVNVLIRKSFVCNRKGAHFFKAKIKLSHIWVASN